MTALKRAVHVLHQKRNELERKVERINYVLDTLGNLSNGKRPYHRKNQRSAAVRARMAAAQKARWAKTRKAA